LAGKNRNNEVHFFSFIKSVFRDTTQSIKRNNLMSMVSVLSVVAALIILGIFIVFSVNLEQITQNVESALELKVFLKAGITTQQMATVEEKLKSNDNISEVTYVSADEALQEFSTSLEGYSGLLSGYNSTNNPMQASFTVRVNDPEKIRDVKSYAESLNGQGVDYVKYGEEYVDAMVKFSDFSKVFCAVMLGILTLVSIFIIYNTIKLTCFARRREIRVMRYVGAADWYIRLPFVLEGTFLGCIGAVAAMLIIRTGYYFMIAYVNHSVYIPMDTALVSPSVLMGPISLFCILYGVIIGACGSLFSIRKFLDA
jgi:cell division transport system permease protein